MPDAYENFGKLVPDGFINEACACIVIRGDKYRPIKEAHRVRCPILLQVCDRDTLLPTSAAEETAKKLGEYAEMKHYPFGHFDVYTGDGFERSVGDQLAFFWHYTTRNLSFL